MKNKKNKKLFLVILVVIIFISIVIYEKNKERSIFVDNENQYMNIDEYYIYGTHLNIKGTIENINTNNIKNVKIILRTFKNEYEYDAIYNIIENKIEISTSKLINEGIYLEKLDVHRYYIFIKVYYNNESKIFSLKSNKPENLEYYTITNEKNNRKIDLKFEEIIIKKNKKLYLVLDVAKTVLPDTIYDISIDPGHGGSDPGATYGKYKESELALKYSIDLKEKLEQMGLKVMLTRDGSEDTSEKSKFNVYSVYNSDGRVNLVGKSKAKYNLSIHLNSLDTNTLSGTEIYAPSNASIDIAKSFADNIVSIAGTKYSTREINKVEKGVYIRNFTEEEIKESKENAKKNGYEKYDITTQTPYLYMIREVGGVATKAYIDGRNKKYGTNEFYDSKIGVESYLIELGYIINNNDLNNMLNNQSKYINAICKTIKDKIILNN